jgi:hypothetical protein
MAKKITIIVACLVLLCSCAKEEGYEISKESINIFKNTEAWDLAVAVNKQNIRKIEKIAERNPGLLNFQDSYYRVTLLMWAVAMEKYESAEALLKCGADPNIIADGIEIYKMRAEEAIAAEDLDWFRRALILIIKLKAGIRRRSAL